MKIGIVIQARMTSTRLPQKIMLQICGKTVLEHLVQRLKQSRYKPQIIIATTINEQDDILVDFAYKHDLGIFRGSEEDVLERYYLAANKYKLDVVVRITSDCPLYEVDVLDTMLEQFINMEEVDYLSNVNHRTFPRGLDTEVFTYKALEKCYQEAHTEACREHVTPYIYQNPEKFKIKDYTNIEDLSNYRWTLDTIEDFELISQIYNTLYMDNTFFKMDDILKAYEKFPEWNSINAHIEQKKVGYKGV